MNSADLPSRGCETRKLLELKWWEGPEWLKLPSEEWPSEEGIIDKGLINEELRKTPVRHKAKAELTAETSLKVTVEEVITNKVTKQSDDKNVPWYLQRVSAYPKILRVVAWTLRFIDRCKRTSPNRKGEINAKEINAVESFLCKLAQEESFKGEKNPRLQGLQVFKENRILRTRTIIAVRSDTFCFRCPIILDPRHLLTEKIVYYTHVKLNHAGIGIVMSNLREKFWILQSRKTLRSVIKRGVMCRRHNAKRMETSPAILPEPRVRDAATFEVTGIDYAGP